VSVAQPVILATQEAEIMRILVQSWLVFLKARPYLKNTQYTHKRSGGVAQVVEHLPKRSEALSSSPSKLKNKKQVGHRLEPVVHACNLSYSEDRTQKDHNLKPAQANE
jgi:hypothetical protein